MKLAALALALLGVGSLQAQLKVLHVDPVETDPAIEAVHGPHLAVYDPQAVTTHRLFVFLVGTKGTAESSLPIDSAFAKWGYHAIGLDYEDNVVAVSCAHDPDSACFDHYRETIVTGAKGSDKVKVDPANSILNRLQKVLIYLVKNDPDGGWAEFLADDKPAWDHIVIAGHSQGAGHAAYIGKMFAVDRVLMFSGPQDYLDDMARPARWESGKSATAGSRYFAFLNAHDPYNVKHQIASCAVLMGVASPRVATVQPGQDIHGDYQVLVNDETTGPHGTTILPRYESTWKYMATAGVH